MIKGNLIYLRTFEEGDIFEVLKLRNNIEAQAPFNGQPLGTQARFLKTYQETGLWTPERGTLLFVNKNNQKLGQFSMKTVSDIPNALSLGYMVYELKNRGKGYCKEAVKLFLDYLMNTRYNLNRIQIKCHKDNIGSVKIAEACGFIFEATIAESFFIGGRYNDENQYCLLRRYWNSAKSERQTYTISSK